MFRQDVIFSFIIEQVKLVVFIYQYVAHELEKIY